MDASLVGVCADAIVRYALCHPHGSSVACSLAHKIHNPYFVRVADRESLTTAVVAIFADEACHHVDCLTRCLASFESDIDERTVVDDTILVRQAMTSAPCRFGNGDLPFVDITHHAVGMGRLWNFAKWLVGVPLNHLAHCARRMVGSRGEI